ncbi:hypothetical protein EDM54_07405, partial [Brevibacillus borstelensis]
MKIGNKLHLILLAFLLLVQMTLPHAVVHAETVRVLQAETGDPVVVTVDEDSPKIPPANGET